MSYRLPISFGHEARQEICMVWRAVPRARERFARLGKNRLETKSSDNWPGLLLNGPVNDVLETAAFFRPRVRICKRFGRAGSSSSRRMG